MPAEYLNKLKAGFDFGLQQAGTKTYSIGYNTKIIDSPKSKSQ